MSVDPEERLLAGARREAQARAAIHASAWPDSRPGAAGRSAQAAQKSRPPVVAAIIAVLMGIMALIGLRDKIVQAAPPVAGVYAAMGLPVNLAGLELRGFRSRIVIEGGNRALAVEGEIVNLRRQVNVVPPVALTVRGADGREKYAWTVRPPKDKLAAGETVAFRTRLASPPESGVDVLAQFDEARGQGAPTR